MKKLVYYVTIGALFLVAVVGMAIAGAGLANATDEKPTTACLDWKLRGVTGTYGAENPDDGIKFGDKPAGSSYNANSATLTKPSEGVMPGVEFATYEAGIEFDTPVTLSAKFTLNGDSAAMTAAGAIRMFYYEDVHADTINDTPTAKVDVTSDGTFSIPNVNKIGTLGFAYDASNSSKGAVTISDVQAGAVNIKFKGGPCKVEATPTANPTTVPPSPSVTKKPAASPSVVPTLPKTGPVSNKLALIGLGLIAFGVVFIVTTVLLKRARRRSFHA